VRRIPVMAALSALVLTLSGCLGGGPSTGDVSKVQLALEALGPRWKVEYVDNTGSDSEGLDHDLAIGLHHDARVESGDLIELFTILAEALPDSYRFKISLLITAGPDGQFPNLVQQAKDVGLDPGFESFYEHGEITCTVKDLSRIVDEYKP